EELKTESGLLLSAQDASSFRYKKAEVISVGNSISGLNKGDKIYYDKHAGYGIEFEKKYYLVIKEQDVVVVL
ncbi:MAG: co-chaperone GroES, partial [Parvibaculum sp.]|nr:co-chaperone GroES [Parvibaculum sp.]